MNGAAGPSGTFKEALPQDSVLFPLLFAIYIGDLLAKFKKDAFVSVYADVLLIARSAQNKDMIVACETAFFSLERAEVAKQPNITIEVRLMFCNPFQAFLGVRYDRQLTFAEHVQKLCQSMSGRLNFLRALGDTTL